MELSSSQLQHRSQPVTNAVVLPVKMLQIVLYAAAVLLLSAAVAWLFVAIQEKALGSTSAKLIFSLAFWCIGLAHIFIYHPLMVLLQSKHGLLFSMLLAILVSIAVWLVFHFLGLEDLSLTIIAAVGFLLPHVIQQLTAYFFGLIIAPANGWVIPQGAEPDRRMSLLLNSMHFKIQIKVKENDPNPFRFSVNLPDRLQLSTVFLRFLYDRQNEVEITDEQDQDYEWSFYIIQRLGFKKLLDPAKTLAENGVGRGDVIHIDRVIPVRKS